MMENENSDLLQPFQNLGVTDKLVVSLGLQKQLLGLQTVGFDNRENQKAIDDLTARVVGLSVGINPGIEGIRNDVAKLFSGIGVETMVKLIPDEKISFLATPTVQPHSLSYLHNSYVDDNEVIGELKGEIEDLRSEVNELRERLSRQRLEKRPGREDD